MSEFKIVLYGSSGSGKTTFINRHLTGEFGYSTNFNPYQIVFNTTRGKITLNLLELNGNVFYDGIRDGYFENADAGIFMREIEHIEQPFCVHSYILRNIPVVDCISKCDLNKVSLNGDESLVFLSSKNNINLVKPFLILMRNLMKDSSLEILEHEPILVPEA